MSTIKDRESAGNGRWLHMAGVMAQRLDCIIENKRVSADDIPKGVARSAVQYFKILLEASTDVWSTNTTLDRNINLLVTDKRKKNRVSEAGADRSDVSNLLEKWAAFVNGLQQTHPLTVNDLKTASELRNAFSRIYQEAECDAYERAVALEIPYKGF